MTTLVLTEEETKKLKEKNAVVVTRNDFTILVETFGISNEFYKITLLSPYKIELYNGDTNV